MIKIITNILIIIILLIVQISFLHTWPISLLSLNLVLAYIIFTTVIINYGRGIVLGVIAGFILDIYSLKPFGAFSISIVLTVILVNILFNQFFTNRSYYSLVTLGVIGTFFYYILLRAIENFYFWLRPLSLDPLFSLNNFSDVGWQIISTTIMSVILFFIFNFISRRAKSVFLTSE